MSTPRVIATDATQTIGDFRRYPGCRALLSCGACGWWKSYDPERIIDRLRQLRAGGHTTRMTDVLRRVGWNCPRCSRMRWRMTFAWPPEIGPAEVKRLTAQMRS